MIPKSVKQRRDRNLEAIGVNTANMSLVFLIFMAIQCYRAKYTKIALTIPSAKKTRKLRQTMPAVFQRAQQNLCNPTKLLAHVMVASVIGCLGWAAMTDITLVLRLCGCFTVALDMRQGAICLTSYGLNASGPILNSSNDLCNFPESATMNFWLHAALHLSKSRKP